MELPYDLLLLLYDTLEDSRGLFLTCQYLYVNCNDKIYWQARENARISIWPPKIKTSEPIATFAGYGNIEMVKYLVSIGADITANDHGAVRWASSNGHLEVVKYLISLGADITANDNYAVQWASGNGYLAAVKYLISLGADITVNDNYAVQWASSNGHLEIVKYLMSVNVSL